MRRVMPVVVLLLACSPAAAQPRPMTPEDLWAVKRVGAPSVSPDGKWAAVEVTTWDVPKDEGSSQLWLLATDGSKQVQLTHTPGKNAGPKWSPDGSLIAFTSKRAGDDGAQVYVIAPAGGEARRVSDMPMSPSGLKWGADSKTLYAVAWTWPDTPDDAGYRARDRAEKEKKAKAVVIDATVYRYWDRWLTDGKRPVVFGIDVAGGKHTNLMAGCKLHLPPYEPGADDYDVSPDGKELCFVGDASKDPGLDPNADLFALPIGRKGEPRNLTADNAASDTSPVYSPDGKSIAFLRQTTKFFYADRRRLMLHDGEKARELTADLDRSCSSPRWLPDGKRIAVEVEDAGYVRIAFVGLDGKRFADATKVSERSIDFARDVRMGVYLRNSFDEPPTVFAHGPGMKEPRQLSHFNDELVKSWKLGKVESVAIKGADDAAVQMWVFYPPDFDPAKKWPLVQMVHGGPHNGIMSEFSFRWNPQVWAARGYVVGVVNFHGSSGFGQAFTDSITGDYGTKPLADVMRATDWFEAKPWIDKNRMAAAGGSYGGYMMAWLNGHTDRFKAHVCHAGVYSYHSQMASDVVSGRQRALGAFPWLDMEKIDRQSAQRFAANFKTPTLVLHGEKDYRVPVTQGFEYYNTLRQKGVPTRLVYFPDENHWVLKPQNALVWHREVFGWLERFIGRGPTP
ncbi:S9 family peptidase [Urbifossiella limnaea]|uniref:Acyl-peptide hydrolase n=1 Tax=Urbifossiella limnaea TaxID=2528023 RepID=A0A517XNJ6_9BACT|nr:S9 family peptidase [Urbifossiella limnaea]QDU19081.1 Prolyl tripeptidyl peptidase precursor [Urbifossiella limnaea]